MGQMTGKNVFLTGASKGMGREMARGLAKEGATIALVARTESALKELAEEMQGLGGRGVVIPADVSDKDQVKEAVRRAREELGEIHVLINSAGVLDNEGIAGHNDEAWEYHYGVNVNSYFYTIREIIGEMFDRGAGRVINIASTSSKVPIGPNRAAYVSSKHAVLGLTKEVAFEAAPHGVTVNAICPGFVLTDMGADSRTDEMVASWRSMSPLGRLAEPSDVAAMALFLASTDGDYCTGQAMNVAGGMVMH